MEQKLDSYHQPVTGRNILRFALPTIIMTVFNTFYTCLLYTSRISSVTAPSSPSWASASKNLSAECPGAGAQQTAQTKKQVPPRAARIFHGAAPGVPLRRTRSVTKIGVVWVSAPPFSPT